MGCAPGKELKQKVDALETENAQLKKQEKAHVEKEQEYVQQLDKHEGVVEKHVAEKKEI